MGKKYLRFDDYPNGMPNTNIDYKFYVGKIINLLEINNINYIWGVTPELLTNDDIQFINENVKIGKIVMHGFNHKFDFKEPWNNIVKTWINGGEFENMSYNDILIRYNDCHKKMKLINNYDKSHHIPPFNCYNQNFVDVMDEVGITYLHTCDKEYNEFNYNNINHYNINVIKSIYHDGYDFVDKVKTRLRDDIGQITLHWIFDKDLYNWYDKYVEFINELKKYEDFNYTGKW